MKIDKKCLSSFSELNELFRNHSKIKERKFLEFWIPSSLSNGTMQFCNEILENRATYSF